MTLPPDVVGAPHRQFGPCWRAMLILREGACRVFSIPGELDSIGDSFVHGAIDFAELERQIREYLRLVHVVVPRMQQDTYDVPKKLPRPLVWRLRPAMLKQVAVVQDERGYPICEHFDDGWLMFDYPCVVSEDAPEEPQLVSR